MRRRLETAISLLLAAMVIGVGCGICLMGTLAARGDLSWTLGGAQYRLWLIREREGAGLALSQTVVDRNPQGARCTRTRVWFWLWTPRMSWQQVHYEECPPSGQGGHSPFARSQARGSPLARGEPPCPTRIARAGFPL